LTLHTPSSLDPKINGVSRNGLCALDEHAKFERLSGGSCRGL
jgi:hypothetical protein